MTTPFTTTNDTPFACVPSALDPADRRRHFEELGPALRAATRSVRELPDGYELELPADLATWQRAAEWAWNERRCCPFLDIGLRLERAGGGLWLRLGGRPGAKEFIRAEVAAWVER